jgi:hypothetical protein
MRNEGSKMQSVYLYYLLFFSTPTPCVPACLLLQASGYLNLVGQEMTFIYLQVPVLKDSVVRKEE